MIWFVKWLAKDPSVRTPPRRPLSVERLEDRSTPSVGQVVLPLPNPIVDGYGYAAPTVPPLYHAGEDYHATPGTPVAALADGTIVYSGADPNQPQRWNYDQRGYGNVVIIEHTRADGSQWLSIYGHLSPNGLRGTGAVLAGQTIGFVGHDIHNGAGGPHLHLQTHDGPYVDTSYARVGGWLRSSYVGWQTKMRPSSVLASWNFDRGVSGWSYGRHGWSALNAVNLDNASSKVWTLNPNASDPGIRSEPLRLDPRYFTAIRISLRSDMPDNQAQLFFRTRNDPTWSESKSLTVTIPTRAWTVVNFDMRRNAAWITGGEITGLRLDPGRFGRGDSTDRVQIDWIRGMNLVSMRSHNYPDHLIRHRNRQAFIERELSTSVFRLDSSFIARLGLADSSGVSFESLNMPGYFLRHRGYRLVLEWNDGSTLFKEDATFFSRPGLADSSAVSFESFNFRGHYLRHWNYEIWLDPFHNSSLFREDATFRIT